MIIYNGKIITGLTGKWVIPNHAFDISYSTVPNGSISGPSTAYGGDTVTVTSTPSSGYLLDYITVNGVAIQGNTFTMPYGNVTVGAQFKINYNPLNLPPYTIRVGQKVDSLTSGFNLTKKGTATYVGTDTVDGINVTVWDVYYPTNNWSNFFDYETWGGSRLLVKVYGANSTGVTNMSYMFRGNTEFGDSGPRYYSLFDTSTVTDMSYMFMVNLFASISEIIAYNTHNVTNMSHMYDRVRLNTAGSSVNMPLLDTSNVTNISGMFYELKTTTLEQYDRLTYIFPNYDFSKVTDAHDMFNMCKAHIVIPKWNLSSLQNMTGMFYACNFLEQNSAFDLPSLVTCDAVYRNTGYGDSYNVRLNAYAQYQKMAASPYVTSHSMTFNNCPGNEHIPQDWGGWGMA